MTCSLRQAIACLTFSELAPADNQIKYVKGQPLKKSWKKKKYHNASNAYNQSDLNDKLNNGMAIF